jgi:hypothetical protein
LLKINSTNDMKTYFLISLLLFVTLTGCLNNATTASDEPKFPTQPQLGEEDTTIAEISYCNAIKFTKNENCFKAIAGGLGAIELRDFTKTAQHFVMYEVKHVILSGQTEESLCLDLYDKIDPAAVPFETVCFDWITYAAVAVATNQAGELSIHYYKQ